MCTNTAGSCKPELSLLMVILRSSFIVPPYGPGLVGQDSSRLGLKSSQSAVKNEVSGSSVTLSHEGYIAWETPIRTNGSFWLGDRGASSAEIITPCCCVTYRLPLIPHEAHCLTTRCLRLLVKNIRSCVRINIPPLLALGASKER